MSQIFNLATSPLVFELSWWVGATFHVPAIPAKQTRLRQYWQSFGRCFEHPSRKERALPSGVQVEGKGGVHPIEHLTGCEKALKLSTEVNLDGTNNSKRKKIKETDGHGGGYCLPCGGWALICNIYEMNYIIFTSIY
jgi:hypothetical protein